MEPRKYRNFTLRVSPVKRRPTHYHVRIYGLIPGGQPSFDEQEITIYDPKQFKRGDLNLLDAMQCGQQLTAKQLYKLGAALSDILLTGSINQRWWESLKVVRERKLGLRLRLLIDSPKLISLPWEFLYLRPPWETVDSELYFLALQPDISIVRHEVLDFAEPSLIPQSGYRLVVAQASPTDQTQLALDTERKAIEATIARLSQTVTLQPTWIEKATRQMLREALRTPADILHFSGHGHMTGNCGQISLEKEGGITDPYQATSLASLIQASQLRLAILNACETGARSGANPWSGVASALVRTGVAAVVASQYVIQDTNATPLADEIYRGVFGGLTIDEAVSNARRAIYQETGLQIPDWGAPVLYLRAEEGFIFPTIITPSESPHAIPHILPPRQDTPLLGRDEELNQAQNRLEAGGKYYFYGTYGVGKTSLANELYRRLLKQKAFTDGCLWDRVSHLSAENVLDRVAGKFAGLQVAQAPGRDEKIRALSDLLGERNDLLIALDEVDDKAVAHAVLQATGNCTILINGTQRLNLAGAATEKRLQPLKPAIAVELFKTLARPSGSAFGDDEMKLVTDICRRMRYLPLAVKLAALKYAEGIESLQELRDRLVSEPESLLSEEDGVVAIFTTHHADLKKMPTALNLLVRITSFPALEAPLKALQANQSDFFSSKDKLVDLGLVDYAGSNRLVLHPLLGNQIQRAEPEAIAYERERAAGWLMDYATRNRENYAALDEEQANLLALLDRYAAERHWDNLVSLLFDLFDYLRVRGLWQEAFERFEAVVDAAGQVTQPWNLAWTYLHRGIVHALRAEYNPAEGDFDQADQLFTEVGDQAYRGKTLYHRASVSILQGALNKARGQLEQAIAWMGETAPRPDRAGAHERLASLLVTQGETEAAQAHFEAALTLGDPEKQARAHIAMGQFARQEGNYEGGQSHFTAARQLIESINDVLTQASLYHELGYIHYYQGRYNEARSAFEQAVIIFADLKYQPGLAQVHHDLGNVALANNQLDEAKGYYRNALHLNEMLGQNGNAAYNQYQLGVVARRQGQDVEAEGLYDTSRKAAEQMNDVSLLAAALHQMCSLALRRGDSQRAWELNRQVLSLTDRSKDRLTEASALYYRGLLQAEKGSPKTAMVTLELAKKIFVDLNSPEADKVATLLTRLDPGGGEMPASPLEAAPEIDVIKALTPSVLMKPAPEIDVIEVVQLVQGDLVGAKVDAFDEGILDKIQDIDVVKGIENVENRIKGDAVIAKPKHVGKKRNKIVGGHVDIDVIKGIPAAKRPTPAKGKVYNHLGKGIRIPRRKI